MPDFTIRPATEADAPDLTKVFAAAYAPFLASLPDLPDVTGGLAADIAAHQVWVAEREGRVLGGVVLVWGAGTPTLANLAVHPEEGGRGLGRRLIAVVEEACRKEGAATLVLASHASMTDTLALYRRLGWRETGRSGNKVQMEKTL
ncbi:MAG: GNAT family N-acetyltransferase [Pseudomonadota bacterium]